MKIVQINTFCGVGSVGRICVDLYDVLGREGHEPYIAVGRGKLPEHIRGFKNGNLWDFGWHVMKNFFEGKAGFGSKRATKKLIAWLTEVKPDVIHLHNIHGFYLQTEMLFDYLKQSDAAVIWTLHDCWTFTGHCAYFDYIGCDKWQQGCEKCKVHATAYPYALFKDNTKWNYAAKKKAYTGVPNLTIVTPSRWLADMVKKSYLKDYPVEVIPNGINLDVFCPADEAGEADKEPKEVHSILGVANIWEERKGLVYFEQMAEKLPEGYVIRLVGVNDRQEKQLKKKFPDGKIRPIKRTKNVKQLAQLYREADVYVNATMEDNFPTTNLEALACGTPVVTFRTGGSPESLGEKCGIVVPKGDVDALTSAVRKVCEEKPFDRKDCRQKALEYGRDERYMQYISLYESVL
nr:glycosyltransferase [Lachnospiraceae bacterium]